MNYKKRKIIMWYQVQELTQQGLNKSQIHREIGLDRSTVLKYQNMEEAEFHQWIRQSRNQPKKLANYKSFVKDLLRDKPYLSAAQVEDRLKEHYEDLPNIHSKTVYNFVLYIRSRYDIPKPSKPDKRVFEKLPEPPFGKQAQVDFGQTWLLTKQGTRKKVHFFTMVLSRSRYKFVMFEDKPFTAETASNAHNLAFSYFTGVPKEIIYDQDSVFLYDENLGDYLLTQAFSSFCKTQDFKAIFCRKADPQSKGKIESVVKYVKQNFLRGRTFINIEVLNQEALSWLKRTGNAKVHSTTKLVPAKQWEEEKKHLLPLKKTQKQKQLNNYKVRKDNTICYKSNFYSLPLGTYKDKDSSVMIGVNENKLTIYTMDNKQICTHNLCLEKGQSIRNSDHRREKSKTLEEYQKQVLDILGQTETAKEYLELLHKNKSRYYRDNLQYIIKNHNNYTADNTRESLLFCIENKLLNASYLIKILDKKQADAQKEEESLPQINKVGTTGDYTTDTEYTDVEISNINQYEEIF